MRALFKYLAPIVLAPACAAIGSSGAGDRDLPTAGVGPFRKLEGAELLGVAPFVLDSNVAHYRQPAILPLDPASNGTRVALFAVALQRDDAGSRDVIVRTHADDARSFFGTSANTGHAPAVVLVADAPWEGGQVSGPCAVWIAGEVFLFYAAQGGIGVARSRDGLTFRKEPSPVLAADVTVTWETAPPSAPSVAVYPDGTLRMLYVAGRSIGEAESADGITWKRVGKGPVLGPSLMPDPGTLAPGEKPPFDSQRVSDPWLAPRTTPAGRLHVRVLYTGYDASGQSAIGFAARYERSGPLSPHVGPIYAVGKQESAPTLFEWEGGSLLYVQQDRPGELGGMAYPAIAAAFAPANLKLGAALTFADSP